MPAQIERSRYTRVAIWLHWITAAIVLWNLGGGIASELLPKSAQNLLFTGHKALGITVLFLTVARIAWRLAHRPPPLPPMPRWQAVSAGLLHRLFYVLLLAMPLSGWVFSSAMAKRWPLTFFGLFDIPYLPVPQGEGLDVAPRSFHIYVGWAMAALVALHIAAALKHHLVDRDRTLERMLPGAKQDPR